MYVYIYIYIYIYTVHRLCYIYLYIYIAACNYHIRNIGPLLIWMTPWRTSSSVRHSRRRRRGELWPHGALTLLVVSLYIMMYNVIYIYVHVHRRYVYTQYIEYTYTVGIYVYTVSMYIYIYTYMYRYKYCRYVSYISRSELWIQSPWSQLAQESQEKPAARDLHTSYSMVGPSGGGKGNAVTESLASGNP